ncbi:MAG: hydroxyacylglutathione hydrolase [Zoogloeaceae bacterium]|jgi:hydroxyacylglutathione hydrolase|nr:hydroxyacylglutathione hydrolase [Zoogloeaceae bacterium]
MSVENQNQMFEITTLTAFRDNYIWGLSRRGQAAIVDPGDAGPALAWLAREGLALEAILITHHHQDHQGGVAGVLARYPNAHVYGPGCESITGRTRSLRGGERFALLGVDVDVLNVAAHTRGHLAYHAGDALFCGDTLFGGGCGRLFEGTPEDMVAALAKLAALPDATRVFCAHEYTCFCLEFALQDVEPENLALRERLEKSRALRKAGLPTVPSTLALEKATNPFMRVTEPQVVASARAHAPDAVSAAAILAALLAMLDAH